MYCTITVATLVQYTRTRFYVPCSDREFVTPLLNTIVMGYGETASAAGCASNIANQNLENAWLLVRTYTIV